MLKEIVAKLFFPCKNLNFNLTGKVRSLGRVSELYFTLRVLNSTEYFVSFKCSLLALPFL